MNNYLQRIRRFDEERPNIPGEHWIALAGGIALWLATRRSRTLAVRIAGSVVGSLLVARAAQGRDVPAPIARWLSVDPLRRRAAAHGLPNMRTPGHRPSALERIT